MSDSVYDIRWVPQEGPQRAFYEAPFDQIFYGGSRGGGKSDALLGKWLKHLIDNEKKGLAAHCRGLIIRRHHDELSTIIDRARTIFAPPIADYYSSKNIMKFRCGAQLIFRHLERDDDAHKYQGREFTYIAVDEIGAFPSPVPIDQIVATLRSSKGIKTIFACSGNPGGVGHNWLKQRFIDPAPPMEPFYPADASGSTQGHVSRVFIPARVEDNKILMAAQPDYIEKIKAATASQEWLQRAWLYGDWDIVAGGMFSDIWRPEFHILPDFNPPRNWRVYRAYDWGSAHPFSIGWWARTDGTGCHLPDGRTAWFPRDTLIRVRELYGASGPNQGIKVMESEIAEAVIGMERNFPFQVHPGPADVNIFQSVNGTRLVDEWIKRGIHWEQANKAAGTRITGWQMIRERLAAALPRESSDGSWLPPENPAMYVCESCVEFIRCLPAATRDKLKIEDLDSNCEDHILDETRYMVLHKPSEFRNARIRGT